jgi:hypothetical protein
LEVLSQATTIARRVNPHAILVNLDIGPIRGGTVDATSDEKPLRFDFEYAYTDDDHPAGQQDTRSGRIRVTGTKGRFQTTLQEGITTLITGAKAPEKRSCSLKRVWRGLVETGLLTDDSSASLSYSVSYWGGVQPREEWLLMKAGASPQEILVPECATREPSSSVRLEVPIVAPNLAEVEPLFLVAQARALARRFDEHMVLIEIHASPLVSGVVNLKDHGNVRYEFAYRYLDASSVPGRDERAGKVTISSEGGRLVSRSWSRVGSPLFGPTPVEPTCGVAGAWRNAVASGVPASAEAHISWRSYLHSWGAGPAAWSFAVDGHPEYARELDVASCKRLGGATGGDHGKDGEGHIVNPWLPKPGGTKPKNASPFPPSGHGAR